MLFTGYLILFNISCGLDTFYVLNGSIYTNHTPLWNDPDIATGAYFDFTITEERDPGEPTRFIGFDVYYKIYKSSSILQSQVEDLISISDRSDSNNDAANKLIESYKYQPLRGAGFYDMNVLFPSELNSVQENTKKSTRVNIRLSDYRNTYFSQIKIKTDDMADFQNLYGNSSRVIPIRKHPNNLTFNFDALAPQFQPLNGDEDVNSNGTSTESCWYVSMFALGKGMDESYSPIYSNIVYLGSVKIPLE